MDEGWPLDESVGVGVGVGVVNEEEEEKLLSTVPVGSMSRSFGTAEQLSSP
jgi:hypothetical protein